MKKRLPPVVRGIALGIALLGGSCTKNTQEAPTPAAPTPVGPSITGRIQPVGALSDVALVDTATHQTVVGAAPDGQGAYQFTAVRAGTYDLYFNAWPGYVRPRQQRVTVTAGKTTVVPPVTVVQSTGSVTADGAVLPAPLVSRIIGHPTLFTLVLSDDVPGGARGTYRLELSLPYAVRVGTYALDGAAAYAVFYAGNAGGFDSRLPASPVPSGGTLTVTAVDNPAPHPRSVSGTFRFTGTAPAQGTQKTVSGTFQNASF
ncbi:carboxypeptidase regulatory-like domain-containing protein [Hymenobacter sp. BT683]|uniref:Carboxypeptidase regulatory-like domain-containing protein n=1 Tax=Hymenobacter jeongseonensis TaxID=2791027 RepID=A0ABS0IJ49_9BACT|nr:carboxypeptidase-like regulatory domain-containing protein [Hymenobacter jeongseonensis]MBF9238395.1 carboxypeptidase regulatory-like domain-containing protein [Hymenobacter jeongseonensis]